MTPQTLIKRKDDIFLQQVEDKYFMLDLDSNSYFGMNRISKEIWERISEPVSIQELCEGLTERFAVSREQCVEDVSGFISRLVDVGLAMEIQADQ